MTFLLDVVGEPAHSGKLHALVVQADLAVSINHNALLRNNTTNLLIPSGHEVINPVERER